jgi:hypothetical protein
LSDSRADFDTDSDALLAEDVGADGESDWEFNVDGAIADSRGQEELSDGSDEAEDGQSIAQEAVDDLLADIGDTVSQHADAHDDAGMEAGDSLGGLEIEEFESEIAEAADVGAHGKIELEPAADVSAELGDPEDWDLLDEPSGAGYEVAPSASAAPTVVPSCEVSDEAVRADSEPGVGLSVAPESGASKSRGWLAHARGVAGWLVVSVLLLLGLHGGLASRSDGVHSGGRWSGGGFEVDRIEGRWVDNAVAGPIYLVSGRLRRVAGSESPSGTRLEIRLVDARGHTLDWGPAPLGPAIPNQLLRESNPRELDARQSSRAERLALDAASWRPFEAVLAALPNSADRFELEVSGVPAS